MQPVPLNKVGEYCKGSNGNITLPIEYKDIKTLSILDSGARLAIATKAHMGKMGKTTHKKDKNG